jgi:polysaccharide export outer membrane protein
MLQSGVSLQSPRKAVSFLAVMAVSVIGLSVAAAPAWGQVQAKPAEPPKEQAPQAEAAKAAAADPLAAMAAPVDPKAYKIGAEDVLGVRVWREPDLSGTVVVRPDGKITLPLVGDQAAADLTPEALAKVLTEAYGTVLTNPRVSVAVLQVVSRRYFISGQVMKSGPMPLVTPVTVMEALSYAGISEWAKKSKIVIMRGTQRLKFNYNEVLKGKQLDQNVMVQAGDHIFVP